MSGASSFGQNAPSPDSADPEQNKIENSTSGTYSRASSQNGRIKASVEKPTILRSWNQVARYMGKGVRTVQRWESDFGLPVRRLGKGKKNAVIAYTADLDEWVTQQCVTRSGANSSTRHAELAEQFEQFRLLQEKNIQLAHEWAASVRSLRKEITHLREATTRREEESAAMSLSAAAAHPGAITGISAATDSSPQNAEAAETRQETPDAAARVNAVSLPRRAPSPLREAAILSGAVASTRAAKQDAMRLQSGRLQVGGGLHQP